jgi:F-type H+-transporting ATPase subunit delta
MSELVARKYSQALFEVGKEKNLLDTFSIYLEQVEAMLGKHPELKKILLHPDIPRREKKEFLLEITQGFPIELQGFLLLLIDKKREMAIESIVVSFKEMVKKYKNIVETKVVTAVPLSDKENEALKVKLSKLLKKEIQMETKVDPQVLGGVYIQAGDRIIDGTLRGKLNSLKNELLRQ